MNPPSQLSRSLRSVFERPGEGAVALVDDLLRMCPDRGLQIHWHANRCSVRSGANGSEDVLDFPLRRSVFRAMLARVAALCNERQPHSVSPYGGQGELVLDADPPAVFRVTFQNKTDEQRLDLIPLSTCSSSPSGGSSRNC
jgi:hypothetical protein